MSTLLATSLAGVPLRNPVILAAGTAGNLDEMQDVLDLSRVGALVTKSITPLPRDGNKVWRILDAGPAGMLNAIGLANMGLDAFLEHFAPRAGKVPCAVFASVAGFSIDDYVRVAANLDQFAAPPTPSIPAVELNVSCPNVHSGVEFGSSCESLRELLGAVRPVLKHARMLVKLGPMTPAIGAVARAAVEAGADGLTISNTIPAMAIDVRTRRPKLANVTGGLSGAGLHPVAVKLVRDVHRALRGAPGGAPGGGAPIIGLGGVLTWEHAAEFILAGATAVGMGAALFADPRSPLAVVKGLEGWVASQGKSSVTELRGALEE